MHEVAEPAGPGAPWPRSTELGDRGLRIGGLEASELAERFGTPLLLFDHEEIRDRARRLIASFPVAAYAVKAFTAHAVIRTMLEEGLRLLCASGGEIEACLRAGAPGRSIWFHGNAKSDDELTLAAAAGVGVVIADSLEELARIDAASAEQGRVQDVSLRVLPEVRVETHEAIATGHGGAKFGMRVDEVVPAAVDAAALPALRLLGLHAHAGSQVRSTEPYVRVLELLLRLVADVRRDTGTVISLVDVGGGFATADGEQAALDPEDVAAALRDNDRGSAVGMPPLAVAVEPGRWLVADAGLTLYRVAGRKRTPDGTTLVAVDGGMSDNLRPALYGARHPVMLADRPGRGGYEPVTIVGRHCESGDELAREVSLPVDLARGDLVAFGGTGAYAYSLASAYNRFGRPAVVAVERGHATPWLRREDAADLDRLEIPGARGRGAALPGISIRPARSSDARSFVRLWHEVVSEGRWVRSEHVGRRAREYRRRFRRSWTPDGAEVVALEGERVVGHVAVAREAHPVTRHVATLGMSVASDRRNLGIGSALLHEAFRWCRQHGVEKVVLSVYPSNRAAIALYRSFGFVQEGRLARQSRKSYGDEDEILMAAWIGEVA